MKKNIDKTDIGDLLYMLDLYCDVYELLDLENAENAHGVSDTLCVNAPWPSHKSPFYDINKIITRFFYKILQM